MQQLCPSLRPEWEGGAVTFSKNGIHDRCNELKYQKYLLAWGTSSSLSLVNNHSSNIKTSKKENQCVHNCWHSTLYMSASAELRVATTLLAYLFLLVSLRPWLSGHLVFCVILFQTRSVWSEISHQLLNELPWSSALIILMLHYIQCQILAKLMTLPSALDALCLTLISKF